MSLDIPRTPRVKSHPVNLLDNVRSNTCDCDLPASPAQNTIRMLLEQRQHGTWMDPNSVARCGKWCDALCLTIAGSGRCAKEFPRWGQVHAW